MDTSDPTKNEGLAGSQPAHDAPDVAPSPGATSESDPPVLTREEIENRWELVRILRAGLARLHWGLRLALVGGALLVLAQVASVYRMLADIHPWLGIGGTAIFALLVGWLLLRPLVALTRVPQSVRPPLLPEEELRTVKHCRVQLAYLDRYLGALEANPQLVDETHRLGEARQALGRLRGRSENIREIPTLSDLIVDYETDHILPLLAPLDRRADAIIRKEAVAIGSMTALSSNGTADAFIVLWRNVNLIAAMARLYYGRPGLNGTWLIVRDVAGAILLSSVLEQLTDMGGHVVRRMGEGSRAIPLVGAVVGPVMDGTVNALMTMKVGYLAKERCRSFQAWDPRTTQGVIRRTWRVLSGSTSFLVDELQRRIGSTLDLVKTSADRVRTGASRIVPTADDVKASTVAGVDTLNGWSTRTVEILRGLRRVVRPGDPKDSPDE